MSIAAISSGFITAVRERAAPVNVDAIAAARAPAPTGREGGRRHELVDAMKQVLGVDGELDSGDTQAVFRFAHALMHDLRSIDAGATREGHGRGHAWGRRSWSDLPQRIDTLATAAAASAGPRPELPGAPLVPPAQATPAAPANTAPPLAELPMQPNPVTTTSAAVHLMQVPTSRLLEAFAALHRALGESAPAAPAATARSELAAFLGRLSNALAPDAPSSAPAGRWLDLTA
jgi:hypothetical protein